MTRAQLDKVEPGRTLRDVLARLGPGGADEFLKDAPGFRFRAPDADLTPERIDDTATRFRLGETGLIAHVTIEFSGELGVAVQAVRITNESVQPSPAIKEIDAFFLPLEVTAGDCPRACGFGGGLTNGFYPPRAYRPEEVSFGEARDGVPGVGYHRWWLGKGRYQLDSLESGRSSSPNLPVMFVGWGAPGGETGLWAALEWSGRWRLMFGSERDWRFLFCGGPRVKGLRLEPGETLRLPRVHVGICAGAFESVSNSIRRYVAEALAPDVAGRRPRPVVAYNHWFGLHEKISEELLVRQVDRAAELGLEYFVVDAGWYAATGELFSTGVGNWQRVDESKLPRGLEPVAERVKSRGMGFGLWFEPERAYRGSDLLTQHPEWFWDTGGNSPHLDLTRRDAQDGVIELLCEWVSRLDIRWLRWDNNQAPGPFWDAADPTGKVQFAYVEGLYRVLDELLRRNPNLMIDNCASGGNRVGFGTLHRCGTMVISDHAEDHHLCRIMQTGGARVLPGNYMNSSLYVGELDAARSATPLALLSRMAGAITINGHIANWTRRQAGLVRKHVDAFKGYRHLLMKDFHCLAGYPGGETDWDVVQFIDPGTTESVIFAYRVRGETTAMKITPRRLDAARVYEVSDPFSARKPRRLSGSELIAKPMRLGLKPESGAVRHLKPLAQ